MKKYYLLMELLFLSLVVFPQQVDTLSSILFHCQNEVIDPTKVNYHMNRYVYTTKPIRTGYQRWKKNKKHLYTACLTNNKYYDLIATPIYGNPCRKNKVTDWGISASRWLITDWDIIRECLLCNFPSELQKIIIHSYSEGRDSIFKNIVDYGSKTILPGIGYYYDLRDTNCSYAVLYDITPNEDVDILETHLKKRGLMDELPMRTLYSLDIFIPILPVNEKKEYE